MEIEFLAFCLIVSLVWVVKLLPVSLNGLGVGESAFVGLLGLFGAPIAESVVLAFALFAIQTGTSLLGGLVALVRVLRGARPQRYSPRRLLPGPSRRAGRGSRRRWQAIRGAGAVQP